MKISIYSFYTCTVLLFISNYAYADYVCNGTVTLTEGFGNITDHAGFGNYAESQQCTWIIAPSANHTYLTLFFSKFELEAQWDYLYIYDGTNSTSNLLYSFTGYTIPNRIATPGPFVTIQFYSDKLVTFSGFQLNYSIAQCEDRCSNHGYCIDDDCYCDDGYKGNNCDTMDCPNSEPECGNALGTCPPNTWGPICTSHYCTGITLITEPSAIITDHTSLGDYLPYTNCEWHIIPNNSANSVNLRFTSFDTELSNDTVTIYDGFNSTAKMIGQFSGGFPILQPIISVTGVMRVVFVSNGNTERAGFRAEITTGFCPNNCGQNGYCFFNTCVCDVGYRGVSCDQVTCDNDCSGHGACADSQCQCFSNQWLGNDCSVCNEMECLTGQTSSCPASGITYNQLNSTFYDYIGLQTSDSCVWKLQPPSGDSIGIRFKKYALTEDSVLSVYDPSKLIAQYGSSPYISPIISGSNNLLVTLVTSTSTPVMGSAMVAEYITYFCPNKCSGQGTCLAGVCYCYSGFTGNDCSQASCPNSCSNNGICLNNTCQCSPGFYGADCSSEYCSGTVTLTSRFGTISDHHGGTYYLPNTSCAWIIRPTVPTTSLSLTFSRFQTEYVSDVVRVYDGANTSSPLLMSVTGSWLPYPVRSTGGALYIEFVSSNTNQNSGFTFSWWSNDLCGCADNNSICLDGQCICSSAKSGQNCSQDAQVTPLKSGIAYISEISDWRWKIYSFEVNTSVGQLSFQLQRLYNIGYPEFFLSYGNIPTLTDFLQYHFYYQPDHRLIVHNPQFGVWYLGVYNHKPESYNSTFVSVTAKVGCIDDCGTLGYCVDNLYCFCNDTSMNNNCSGNGICTSGGCACFDGYFGTSCQYSSCSPPCKNGGLCSGYNLCNCAGTGFVGPTCADLPGTNVTCYCLHGGTCDSQGVCECSSGYTGTYCEQWKCDIPCSNGGTCIGANKCQCTQEYQGPFCLVSSDLLSQAKKSSGESSKRVLIGLIVALCCSIIGLGTMVTIAVVLRRSRARVPVAGAAGFDELNSM